MSLYSAESLAKKAGVTYRQVHYWTRLGVLRPVSVDGQPADGSGYARVYDGEALAVARGLGLLAGRSVETMGEHARRAVVSGKAHIGRGFSLVYDATGQGS